MEETEKLCPITRDYCIEEQCGWWSKCNEQCAVSALADGVTTEMERLNRGIERKNAREKPVFKGTRAREKPVFKGTRAREKPVF